MKNKRTGSSFDGFLEAEGILGEVEAQAAKRMFLEQVMKAMKERHLNKSSLRRKLGSPTTVSRLFDAKNTGTELLTFARVADLLGKDIQLQLVDRPKRRRRTAAIAG